MFRTHRTLFNKLALQSVALSTAPSSLYDTSGGSGFPNPSVGLNPSSARRGKGVGMEEANGIVFRKVNDEEMRRLRSEIFGDDEAEKSDVEGCDPVQYTPK